MPNNCDRETFSTIKILKESIVGDEYTTSTQNGFQFFYSLNNNMSIRGCVTSVHMVIAWNSKSKNKIRGFCSFLVVLYFHISLFTCRYHVVLVYFLRSTNILHIVSINHCILRIFIAILGCIEAFIVWRIIIMLRINALEQYTCH